MTLHDPLWNQSLSFSAEEFRQGVAALGDGGVVGASSLAVTQRASGANMSVDVAPGRCVIPGSVGNYLCWSDAVENLSIDAAPSVGNSRIDVVYGQVRDTEAGDGVNDWILAVAKGSASGSPTAPGIPARAIELARITLSSSTTSITTGIITDARAHSAAASDRFWPRRLSAVLAAQTIENVAETWGTVTLVAPNRPVTIEATLTGDFKCASGQTNAFGEVAIRVAYGSRTIIPTGLNVLSENDVSPRPIVQQVSTALDGLTAFPGDGIVNPVPAVGETITFSARVANLSGGPGVVDHGLLIARMFPA